MNEPSFSNLLSDSFDYLELSYEAAINWPSSENSMFNTAVFPSSTTYLISNYGDSYRSCFLPNLLLLMMELKKRMFPLVKPITKIFPSEGQNFTQEGVFDRY